MPQNTQRKQDGFTSANPTEALRKNWGVILEVAHPAPARSPRAPEAPNASNPTSEQPPRR
jgi:hypothetical protein